MFKLLQSLRDEAHRFAITGHRKVSQKKITHSILDTIESIGPTKKRALIAYFGSSKLIANASLAELQKVKGIGPKLALQIFNTISGFNQSNYNNPKSK
jgi:excinuclease ABC subunit C